MAGQKDQKMFDGLKKKRFNDPKIIEAFKYEYKARNIFLINPVGR